MARHLNDGERALWTRIVQDVRPFRPSAPVPAASVRAAAAEAAPGLPAGPGIGASSPGAPPGSRRSPPPLVVGGRGAGVDDASWRALATGRISPARRLDLHGHTVEAAFRLLREFVHHASAERLRCVEIVTGHGRTTGGGAIRRELPHWLNRPELRPLIVAIQHPPRGNDGAVRVLLRRRRSG